MVRTVQEEARSFMEPLRERLKELVTNMDLQKSISRFVSERTPLQRQQEIYVLIGCKGTMLVEKTDDQVIRPLNLEDTSDLEIKLNLKYIGEYTLTRLYGNIFRLTCEHWPYGTKM
eukprot:snap_masked-scaffold_28-processed-gene-4.82-mRNA-1 protein AED:1.00 eAED:1.00 QI:0/-1/0/0/-1/1/1/0/115